LANEWTLAQKIPEAVAFVTISLIPTAPLARSDANNSASNAVTASFSPTPFVCQLRPSEHVPRNFICPQLTNRLQLAAPTGTKVQVTSAQPATRPLTSLVLRPLTLQTTSLSSVSAITATLALSEVIRAWNQWKASEERAFLYHGRIIELLVLDAPNVPKYFVVEYSKDLVASDGNTNSNESQTNVNAGNGNKRPPLSIQPQSGYHRILPAQIPIPTVTNPLAAPPPTAPVPSNASLSSMKSIYSGLISEVSNSLNPKTGQGVLVVGNRGMGKTVLLELLGSFLEDLPSPMHSKIIRCRQLKGAKVSVIASNFTEAVRECHFNRPSGLNSNDFSFCEKLF
jgi:hypothetical protein